MHGCSLIESLIDLYLISEDSLAFYYRKRCIKRIIACIFEFSGYELEEIQKHVTTCVVLP